MQPVREIVPYPPDLSFRVVELRDQLAFSWHVHRELELVYVDRGSGERFIGDHLAAFGDKDLVLIGPEIPHAYSSSLGDAGDPTRAIIVQFPQSLISVDRLPLKELRNIRHLLGRAAVAIVFAPKVSEGIAPAIEEVLSGSGLERLLALLRLLDRLAVDGQGTALSPGWGEADEREGADSGVRMIHELRQFVAEHLADRVTLGSTAQQFGVSTATLCRLCRRHLGITFTDYLVRTRIARACRLLIETDLLVCAVGYRSGFDNLSNFNRRFRRIKGMTPSAYRRRYLAVAAAGHRAGPSDTAARGVSVPIA